MSKAERRYEGIPIGHVAIHAYADGWIDGGRYEMSTRRFQRGHTFRHGRLHGHPIVDEEPDHTRTIFLSNKEAYLFDDCVHKLRRSAQNVRDRRMWKRDR